MRNFLNFQSWAFLFFLQGHTIVLVEVVGNEYGLSSQPVPFGRALWAQEYLSFNVKTPTLRRGDMLTVSAGSLLPANNHLVIFFFFFPKASETLLRWKDGPCLSLPLCSLRSYFLWELQETREEKIIPMGEHCRCSTPAPEPLWPPLRVSHVPTLCRICARTAILDAFPFTRWGLLFLSAPLFTYLPPITSHHQTSLGEFISVYNMLWVCSNNGDVTLFHFYRLFYLKIKVVSYHYHDRIIAA